MHGHERAGEAAQQMLSPTEPPRRALVSLGTIQCGWSYWAAFWASHLFGCFSLSPPVYFSQCEGLGATGPGHILSPEVEKS